MATKKKEEELAAPEAQSSYDTSGLENRQQVEEAMAGAGYRPGQSVTNAANALKEWQGKRPEAYQSSYQDRINEVLDRLLARENFAYSYTQDPLYRQYAQQYTQNAHNASADAAAQAAALTGSKMLRLQLCGQCGTTGLPAADRCAERGHPQPVQSGTGHLHQRRR